MTSTETYTAKITKNSFWGTASFIVTSITGFVMSVAITRYLGKELYGQYSYFLWLTATISLLASFGLSQSLTKYLPRYFFEKENEQKAHLILKKFLRFAIIAGIIISMLLVITIPYIQILTPFEENSKAKFIFIAILCIVPLTLNTLLTTGIAALQQFKKLSLIQSLFSLLNLFLTLYFIFSKQDLTHFLWLFLAINLFTCLSYFVTLRHLLSMNKSSKESPALSLTPSVLPSPHEKSQALPWKEIYTYSAWNYLGTVFGQITWERSEFFFLGLYSTNSDIAIYSLSYSLAILFIGVFGPLNQVLNNITAEVVGTGKKDQLANICQHASKYLAIIMLPAIIYSTLFIDHIIQLLYGKSFSEAAFFFPFLAFSHILAIIVTPASNISYFKNEVRRMTFITILIGIINIALNLLLIPRFHVIGAVAANTTSQLISIMIVLMNARKYELKIFNPYMLRVFLINLALALSLYGTLYFNSSLWLKLFMTTISVFAYIFLIMKLSFNQNDLGILENLVKILPKKLAFLRNIILKRIVFNVHNK